MTEPKVRIFVSSPSDLEHERALVKDVIAALAQDYRPYFRVQAILWEEEALTAAQSFQAGLLRPSECEIVLVMLWTRLGTPLADDPYGGMTGTEWEFVDAVEASARTGSPEVLVYRKIAPRLVDVTNDEATREALADRHRLETFFRTHFFNPDGSFSRAFRQFANDRALRELLETQLRKLLNRRISAERRLASPLGDWHGSPFRAAQPFDLQDDRIFTGRESETRELVARLDRLRERGSGFLLLTGPSGVGKSSLIRAGLLPRLTRPFLFAGIAGCRWCWVELDERDPLQCLADALAAPTALGAALDGFGLDPQRLGRLLTTEPEVAADQVLAALTQVGNDLEEQANGAGGRQQLAVILDPLDPLLGQSSPSAERHRHQSFATALRVLAAREGVWVIATLRSDYLHRLTELPELAALMDEQSWFRLQPPPSARIRQVIEIPARIAGIEYEGLDTGAGRGLVDALEAEASLLTHWPSALQQTLDELYRRASARSGDQLAAEHPLLTLSDYQRVGGLAGSLVARADGLWAELDPSLRAALPILCRALIALEGGGASAPQARLADLLTLSRDPAAAGLLQELIAARLVVAESVADPASRLDGARPAPRLRDDLKRLLAQTGEEWRVRLGGWRLASRITELDANRAVVEVDQIDPGAPQEEAPCWEDYRPVASVIHPVLLERWQPVRDWLADPANRRALILRYQISRQARLWLRTDCNREYLLGESGYAAARGFATEYPAELEPLEQAFLEESRQSLVLQRRRNRRARVLGLTLVSLLLLATTAALWAWQASRQATMNLQLSQLHAADNAIRLGDTPEAVRLTLDAAHALPVAAMDTLARVMTTNRLVAMVQFDVRGFDQPTAPAFSADGQRLVTRTRDGGAHLWVRHGHRFQPTQDLLEPGATIHSVRIIGSGEQSLILGIGEAGVWTLPAEPGQPPVWTCGARPGNPIEPSPDGRLLALADGEPRESYAVCVLDLTQPGAPLWQRVIHERRVRSLAYSPDGRLLVTASRDGTARVIETLTGQERALLEVGSAPSRTANHAVFDAAGERIAVAASDERIRVYDLGGKRIAELGMIRRAGRDVAMHQSAVRRVVFAPSDDVLVAADEAGLVVRWSLATGQAEILGRHALSVEHLAIAPARDPAGEHLVLSASLDRTARVWGLSSGRELTVFGHAAAISEARFSADGSQVMTASDLDGSARLWSIEPIETVAFRLPSADDVWHLAMAEETPAVAAAPDSAATALLLATASSDRLVEVWRYARGIDPIRPQRLWRFEGHRERVRRVAFSPSVRQVASAGYDGTARLWDLASGRGCVMPVAADDKPCEPDGGQTCPNVYRVLFAPDERWLLTASSDPQAPVRLWDPRTCQPADEDPGWDHGGRPAQAAALGQDAEGGIWVATGDDFGTVRVMRRDRAGVWSAVCAGPWHSELVTDLALAPGADWLVSTSEDGRAALVPLADGQCGTPRYLEPHAGILYSARFAPDGQALVTAAMNASAQVWGLDGTRLAELQGHKDRVGYAEISPDGRWILTSSRDGSVRLWPRPTAPRSQPLEALLSLTAGHGGASFATFSPDGKNIAGAYRDNTTRLWRVWSEDPKRDRALESVWGRDRARLVLIREAERFRLDNRL